ncbi:DMT family transporter [Paenibacillus peoriae]|uniref:DMT family transporter n=1 Tax=Paenibacillus peoriae TaxID=59893 RepID=UPI0032AF469B
MGILFVIVLITLIGGTAVSSQSSINGKVAGTIGLLETVFFSLGSGTLILGVLVCFFGTGRVFDLIQAPKLQLAAVFLGFGYLFLSSFNVNKLGVTPANLTAIVGQNLAGFMIDALGLFDSAVIEVSWQRGISVILMLTALSLIFSEKNSTTLETKLN